MSKPTAVLIGGVPGVGKTSVASRVADELGIPLVFGGDLLREFLRASVPAERSPVLHLSAYDCWKAVGSEPSDTAIIEGFKAQGEILNVGVVRMIQRAHRDGESLVLEYMHLLPLQLQGALALPHVYPFLLCVTDSGEHARRLQSRATDTHRGTDPRRLVEHQAEYRTIQQFLHSEAQRANVRTLGVDTIPAEAVASKIVGSVVNTAGSSP